MLLKYLKHQMLLPRKEYIINQRVNIRGIDVLLLSLTVGIDKNCLWLMHKEEPLPMVSSIDEDQGKLTTNRQRLMDSIKGSNRHKYFYYQI